MVCGLVRCCSAKSFSFWFLSNIAALLKNTSIYFIHNLGHWITHKFQYQEIPYLCFWLIQTYAMSWLTRNIQCEHDNVKMQRTLSVLEASGMQLLVIFKVQKSKTLSRLASSSFKFNLSRLIHMICNLKLFKQMKTCHNCDTNYVL